MDTACLNLVVKFKSMKSIVTIWGQEQDIDAQDLSAIDGIHRNSRYNLRPRRERDYSHLHVILESLVMTQYPMHKGIKVFGEAGSSAVWKKFNSYMKGV